MTPNTQDPENKGAKKLRIALYTSPFDEFLRINLSADDYLKLDTHLGCSQHRLTKIKNDPAIIDMDNEGPVLARLLCIRLEEINKKVKEYALAG